MVRTTIRKLLLVIIGMIKFMPFRTTMRIRNLCYKLVLKKMGICSNIADAVTIVDASKVSIGKHVSIHEYCFIGGMGEVTIGDYVAIASNCSIISDSHNFRSKNIVIKKQGAVPKPVVIGNNVWMGTHVAVLGGLKIGDGAVIGAGSVVTKDIPENAIAVGVPCEVMRYR